MTFRTLHTVADHLPFHLDDTPQVNAAFTRWRLHPSAPDKRLIDLWTYCYIYRYFLVKFTPSEQNTPLPFDHLVARTFAEVQHHLDSIRQPECYTGWVGTICRNTFVNYLRTRRSMVSLEEGAPVLTVEDVPRTEAHDAAVVRRSIYAAIKALPGYLSAIARMRLLDNCSYETISLKTGKPQATLRAYMNRAMSHLRRNPSLQTLLEELRD